MSEVLLPLLAYLCSREVRGTSKLSTIINKMLFFLRSWFFDLKYKPATFTDAAVITDEFEDFIKEHDIHYVAEYFDCDDYALAFKAFTSLRFNTNCVGLAIGIVETPDGDRGGHMWNLILVDTMIMHFEPQTCEFLQRRNNELVSSDGFKYYMYYVIW